MGLGIGLGEIIFFASGLALLYFLGYAVLSPMRTVLKLIFNSFLGAAAMAAFNLIFQSVGFTLPVNPVTALIVGFLGLPGLGLIFLLKIILGI